MPWQFLPDVSYFDVFFGLPAVQSPTKCESHASGMRTAAWGLILMCNNELNCHQQGWSCWWLVRWASLSAVWSASFTDNLSCLVTGYNNNNRSSRWWGQIGQCCPLRGWTDKHLVEV
jgi:hypothetical protein